jgi:mRNA-degrading endonuclease RelE of RelBE toxin-antitoxin system
MVVIVEQLFLKQLQICPKEFKLAFRAVYQPLKVVNNPLDVKGISFVSKKFYKLKIDKSRIALKVEGEKITIGLF